MVYPPERRGLHAVKAAGATLGRATTLPNDQATSTFDDPCLSRKHAELCRSATSWELTDLGSSNGSFVNGGALRKHEPVRLADGAVVRIGETLLVFREAKPGGFGDFWGAEQESFPGVSPPALAVRKRLRELVDATGHALVVGETGTGKERAARAFEADGRPFLAINCAELSREFARAELFGYERGAFTGAASAKAGLVEIADKGALFLDEIGELPLDVQGELLRFLEDGSYRRIGGVEAKKSRARVIAATNVDLDGAVRDGMFRRDLLARLRAHNAPVELPPLRERREDILGWADHFVNEAGGRPEGELWSVGAAECLLLYPWPGNLRDLRGTVRSLAAGGSRAPFQQADLPEPLQTHRRDLRTITPGTPSQSAKKPVDPTRAEIDATLRESKGVMQTAARKLGVGRRHLYRLCEKFGINLDSYRDDRKREVGDADD